MSQEIREYFDVLNLSSWEEVFQKELDDVIGLRPNEAVKSKLNDLLPIEGPLFRSFIAI